MLTDARIARIAFIALPTWWVVTMAATAGPVFSRLLAGVGNIGDAVFLAFAWSFVAGMIMAEYWYVTLPLLAIVFMVLFLHFQNRIDWD